MKKIRIIVLSIAVLSAAVALFSFSNNGSSCKKITTEKVDTNVQKQMVNMFVTHGHCSTPFAGQLDRLTVDLGPLRVDGGNPVENMEMSFEINPTTFNACRGEDLTKRVKTPGLFIGNNNENITFRSTNVYTMGLDWYQVNGKLSIKGVEKDVKFFVTGVRNPKDSKPSEMVLEGQFDLMDWGIDYDLIVNGESNSIPTKMMHINMRFGIC